MSSSIDLTGCYSFAAICQWEERRLLFILVHILHSYFPLRIWTVYPAVVISNLWAVTTTIEIWTGCPGENEETTEGKKRKSPTGREREIKIPLLWYLCHHHRWSIRLNIICLTDKDMTWKSKRVKERKKRPHLLQCWQMWRHGRMFPKKNLPRTFNTRNVTFHQSDCKFILTYPPCFFHSTIPWPLVPIKGR